MSPLIRRIVAAHSDMVTPFVCAAAVSAQFVAGKATRDALYLANVGITSLPVMVALTSAFSIAIAVFVSRRLRSVSPAVWVPVAFIGTSIVLIVAAALFPHAPRAAAILVYLETSGVGPLFGSGFWLLIAERFDPHTAKRRFGQIAAAGTIGGLLGGALAERIGATFGLATTMLLVLAALSVASAWQARRLAATASSISRARIAPPSPRAHADERSTALRIVTTSPYLRHVAALVLLGTAAAALVDYVFKAEAVATLGHGPAMLRFFGAYYAVTGVVTFALQSALARTVLEKGGLTIATGAPSIALAAGGLVGMVIPGLGALAAVRGGESVMRSSFFRSGYELLFTPIPKAQRRAAKSLIDVGADRLGDALGAGVVQIVLLVAPAVVSRTLLAATIVCSVLALVAAAGLARGYVATLQDSLVSQGGEVSPNLFDDFGSQTVHTPMLTRSGIANPSALSMASMHVLDGEVSDILALRSRDRARIVEILRREEGLAAALVPHALSLLAWDQVAPDAIHALKKVAEEHVGQLTDILIDPNQPLAVRRRVARILSICVSQRACNALLLGLDDARFQVRFQSGRSLAELLEKNRRIGIDKDHIFRLVTREASVGEGVRESRRLAHIFSLLSLVLPTAPVLFAYRGIQSHDPWLKGTALEYLDSVLPPAIARRLQPGVLALS